jgi:hypothetical protein
MKTKTMVQKTTRIVLSKNTKGIVSSLQLFMLERFPTLFSNTLKTNFIFDSEAQPSEQRAPHTKKSIF